MTSIDVAEWQTRLERAFCHEGVVGGRFFLPTLEREKSHAQLFQQYFRGHTALEDSFMDFYIETLHSALSSMAERRKIDDLAWYLWTLATYATMFYALRAASLAAHHGYGLEGFAILRNVKDQVFGLNALVNQDLPMEILQGYAGVDSGRRWTEGDLSKIRKNKINNDRLVLKKMISKNSGLSPGDRHELLRWNRMFNQQVHGSMFSVASELGKWFENPEASSPKAFEENAGMYMNRFYEISWMTLRLLPFLQIEGHEFGNGWPKRWSVLDKSFRQNAHSLTAMGKKIASAIEHLIDSRFAFSPSTRYFESMREAGSD